MTVDVYQPTTVYSPQDIAVQRLAEWATSAQAAHTIAVELVRTSFVPDAFRGKPHEATAAILAGLEVGLQPMAALKAFDVIGGQAAPRAITLRAVVQSHGHDMILEESTATRARLRGRRRGANEWQTVTWTIDRARSLGLTNKENWKTQPQAMLVARATSELARLVAADAILGIGYSYEEIADGAGAGVDIPPQPPVEPADSPNPPAPSGTRRMSRKRPTPPPEPDPDNDTLSDAQMKKLRALYNAVGVTAAGEQKRITAIILDVDHIATHSTLTGEQASKVIDQLSKIESNEAAFTLNDDAEIVGIDIATDLFTDTTPGLEEDEP